VKYVVIFIAWQNYSKKLHILVPTMKQLLRLDSENNNDNNYLLFKMANDAEYIEPLSKFQKVVTYACVLNDKRVSSYSAAILPLRFDFLQYWNYMITACKQKHFFATIDEKQYQIIKQNFYQSNSNLTINDNENVNKDNKDNIQEKKNDDIDISIDMIDVTKTNTRLLLFEYSNHWYLSLANNVKWERVLICLNPGLMTKYSHTLVATPIRIEMCKPLFEEFKNHFVWQ